MEIEDVDIETKEIDDLTFMTTRATLLGVSGECGVPIVFSTTVVLVRVPLFFF